MTVYVDRSSALHKNENEQAILFLPGASRGGFERRFLISAKDVFLALVFVLLCKKKESNPRVIVKSNSLYTVMEQDYRWVTTLRADPIVEEDKK